MHASRQIAIYNNTLSFKLQTSVSLKKNHTIDLF